MVYQKQVSFRTLFLILIFSSLVILPQAFSQEENDKDGLWRGVLEIPGFQLDLAINLEFIDSTWTGELDIPKQGIKGMSLAALSVSTDSLSFKLPEVPGNASFKGAFIEGGHKIAGIFSQAGQDLSIEFVKEDALKLRQEKERIENAVLELEVLIDSLRVLQEIPAIGVGITRGDEVIMSKGFGFSNLENEVPADDHTLFAIGSSSKAFTAMDLAFLVHEGKLKWDEPVLEYMNDFKLYDEFATKEMTAIDLITHQSGLPRHDLMWYGSSFSREDLYNRLRYLPPNKSFRSTWQYQNLMYMTAGVLVEKISRKTWEEFTSENIFEPLHMDETLFDWNKIDLTAKAAIGYGKRDDQVIALPYRNIQSIGPAGSIISNVDDMLEWVQFHLNKGKIDKQEILPAEIIDKIHSPHKVIENSESKNYPEYSSRSYGLGWMIYNHDDVKIVQHGGNIDGFSALVYLLPKNDLGVVVLTNMNGTGLTEVIANYAVDKIMEKDSVDWYTRAYGKSENDEDAKDEKEDEEEKKKETKKKEPIPNTQPSHSLDAYIGIYEHPGYGKVEISLVEDSLHIKYNSWTQKIAHWHYDVFDFHIKEVNQSILVSFHSNSDGYVDQLSVPLEPTMTEPFYFKKLPPDLMSKEYLDRILGDYELEGGVKTVISKTGDVLYATVTGQPPYELEAYRDDEFKLIAAAGFSVKFYFSDDYGKSTHLEFIQPNGIFKAERKVEKE